MTKKNIIIIVSICLAVVCLLPILFFAFFYLPRQENPNSYSDSSDQTQIVESLSSQSSSNNSSASQASNSSSSLQNSSSTGSQIIIDSNQINKEGEQFKQILGTSAKTDALISDLESDSGKFIDEGLLREDVLSDENLQ